MIRCSVKYVYQWRARQAVLRLDFEWTVLDSVGHPTLQIAIIIAKNTGLRRKISDVKVLQNTAQNDLSIRLTQPVFIE